MIRECEEHGYFREETCPYCNTEGKFILNDFEVEKMGRTMAAILRHGKYNLDMDEQGFVDVRDILSVIKDRNPHMKWLRPHHIEALINTDPKGRYQVSGPDVRATYGHTIKLDLKHPTDDVPEFLYYPISEEEWDIISEAGLLPSDRAMVHLSRSYKDAVRAGSVRMEDPVILRIDTAGCEEAGISIGRAAKTVFLCNMVPPEYIEVVEGDYDDNYEEE